MEGGPNAATADARLYVLLGSHPCRTGMLLLEHKGIPYRTVHITTGLHPVGVRMLGFPGRSSERRVDGRTTFGLRLGNRLGTVPSLKIGGERAQTNRAIARVLDRIQPDPPLFPADPQLRAEVEAAELWGDEELQMLARRLVLAAAMRGPAAIHRAGDDGRLGPLLFHRRAVRFAAARLFGRVAFGIKTGSEERLRASLPAALDHVDELIDRGVLNGEALNAADYMIASSVALLTYVNDLRGDIPARPAATLIDRVLPEPA